jgi:hypothetical protein
MVERVNQAVAGWGGVTDMRPLSRDGNRHEEVTGLEAHRNDNTRTMVLL